MRDGATTPLLHSGRALTPVLATSRAIASGLFAQVENWFINIRMREWRPAMRRALDHAEVSHRTRHGSQVFNEYGRIAASALYV